jgi:hypothetical protein
MATGDVTVHVDLDEVLTLLRAILATAQLTDGKVSQIMTDVGDTQSQISDMAAQIESISTRQDNAAQLLREFIDTHQGGPINLAPLTAALGHLEGTTEEVEQAAADTHPSPPPPPPA